MPEILRGGILDGFRARGSAGDQRFGAGVIDAVQPLGETHECFAADGAPAGTAAFALALAAVLAVAVMVSSSGGAPGISGAGAGISAQPASIPATAESTSVARIGIRRS